MEERKQKYLELEKEKLVERLIETEDEISRTYKYLNSVYFIE